MVYSSVGYRGARVADFLARQGYSQVYNLEGGLDYVKKLITDHVEDVRQPGRGQVQEGQPYVEPGPLPAHLVDQRGHRGGRARIAAAVCDGDEC